MKPTALDSRECDQPCHDTLPWLISFSLDASAKSVVPARGRCYGIRDEEALVVFDHSGSRRFAVAVFISDAGGDDAAREGVIARIANAAWDAVVKR